MRPSPDALRLIHEKGFTDVVQKGQCRSKLSPIRNMDYRPSKPTPSLCHCLEVKPDETKDLLHKAALPSPIVS